MSFNPLPFLFNVLVSLLTIWDPALGVELIEKSYAENCELTYSNIFAQFWDP